MRRRVGFVVCVLALAITSGIVLAQDTQHVHPDDIEEDETGNPAMLQEWFADRLGSIYADCASGLVDWDTEQCELTESDIEHLIDHYRTVEVETTTVDERRGEEFETAGTQQSELASLLASFESTYHDYEEAQTEGEDEEVREHAIELRSLAVEIAETGTEFNSSLRTLDNATTADFETAADNVLATSENTTSIAQDVESTALEQTNLSVEVDSEASFSEPATVSGSLTSSAGEPVSDVEITVIDDVDHYAQATTDTEGQFQMQYRPVATELGETSVTVRYEPASEDPYGGTEEMVSVSVNATPVNVTVTEATTETAYEDEVTVDGRLTAAGSHPSNASIRIVASGTEIATGQTDDDGIFNITGTLPADVPSGKETFTVEASAADRALEPTRENLSMSVSETEMTLFARAEEADDGGVLISGQLTTEFLSTPVAGETITVSIGNENWTATTDEDGEFEIALENPGNYEEALVSYEDPGTNLGNVSVVLPNPTSSGVIVSTFSTIVETGSEVFERLFALDRSILLGGAIAISGGILLLLIVFRRVTSPSPESNIAFRALPTVLLTRTRLLSSSTAATASTNTGSSDATLPETMTETVTEKTDEPNTEPETTSEREKPALLSEARKEIENSPSRAVQMSYAAIRAEFGIADSKTHREAFDEIRELLTKNKQDALQHVTESFERATFTEEGIDRSTASEAIMNAERSLQTPMTEREQDAVTKEK